MGRKRDRGFLISAALAAGGGLTCVGASVVFPLWQVLHGHPIEPTFVFFSLWGIFALAGALANISTYYSSGSPPEKPRGGGQRLTLVPVPESLRGRVAAQPESERKAA